MNSRRISDEICARARDMRAAGYPDKEIVEALGIKKGSLYHILKRQNVIRQPFWGGERDARLREMIAAGKTYLEVSVELGCTRAAAMGRAHRIGAAVEMIRGTIPAPVARLSPSAGDIPPHGCRWLHGDPRKRDWCDKPLSGPERSWCAEHRARVYVSVAKKAAA